MAGQPDITGHNRLRILGNRDDLGLYRALYTVGSARPLEVMLKRGRFEETQFQFLSQLGEEHPTALEMVNYWRDNNPEYRCLIVMPVQERLGKWISQKNFYALFGGEATKASLGPLLRDMILDLVDLIESVLAKGWYPSVTMDNLYVNESTSEGPTLKALLYDVQFGTSKIPTPPWISVRNIIDECCNAFPGRLLLNRDTRAFQNFIGRHMTVVDISAGGGTSSQVASGSRSRAGFIPSNVVLRGYPDTWTDERKIQYISMIIQGEKEVMGILVSQAGVVWPAAGKRLTDLIKQYEVPQTSSSPTVTISYNTSIPLHYIRLCRNFFTKFETVHDVVKNELPSRSHLLRKMEDWKHDIWTALYEKLGPLGI